VSVAHLRRMTKTSAITALWLKANALEQAPVRQCPTCRRRMKEVGATIEADHDLPLDVCTACHFVWFDPREIDAMPPPEEGDTELPPEARQALAKLYVERIKDQGTRDPSLGPALPFWKVALSMFFPVEEEHLLRRFPWATVGLLAAVALFSLLALGSINTVAADWGTLPGDPWRHGGLTLLTAFFLHGSVIHLLGNLYFLWTYGDNVEDYLGPARFLLLIALATAVGSLAHVAFDPRSAIPVIGASAGVSGVIAFYALRFPRVKLITHWVWRFGFRRLEFSALLGFFFWIGYQCVLAYLQSQEATLVSAYGHLGGAAVGVLLFLVWRKRDA